MENTLVLVADDVAQGVAALRIVHGAQHALRLVQGKRDMVWVHAYTRAVHANLLMLRIDTGAEFGDELSVDLDAPIGDYLFAFATRPESRLGQKLLQANTFVVVIVRLHGAGICVWHRSPNVAG